MDSYSIEDIELLRKKSGLSYQEAVALLDYHNGDVARALIDLEKSGRLKDDPSRDNPAAASKTSGSGKEGEFKEKAINIFQNLYRKRIKVQKDHTPILNISVLFGAVCLFFAPHITLAGIVLSMILGYRFSFSSMDADFSSDSIDKMVRNAAQNAKNSVNSVVQNLKGEQKNNSFAKDTTPLEKQNSSGGSTHPSKPVSSAAPDVVPETDEDPAEALKKQTKEIEKTMDSFFESNPAATTYRSAYSAAASSVPTLQVPVQAEAREGTVEIGDDKDGYSSVTIG